jgi:hypothetical protein
MNGEPFLNFKMKKKILKLKIFQWMHRKFAVLQRNHQKSIHETIPLKISIFSRKIPSVANSSVNYPVQPHEEASPLGHDCGTCVDGPGFVSFPPAVA